MDKGRILDELCAVTGWHRKHAVRALASHVRISPEARRQRSPTYGATIRDALVALWEASDRICGKRLKVMIPTLLPSLERHGRLKLDQAGRALVLGVSAATIDRLLVETKIAAAGGKRRRVGFYSAVRREVPIRTFNDWHDPPPGFCEVDMVAHGGTSVAGSFIQTLTMVDVATGWTECMPLLTRESGLVVRAMERAQNLFPWLIRGADFDNDSAFMNDVVVPWCRAQKIEVTRSRAYKKNDQAFVEQKNGAVVRRLVGYGRFDGVETTRVLERLYAASRLHTNFFQPSFKLKSKTREGARVHKKYELPETPCRRLLLRDDVSSEIKEALKRQMEPLDPVLLLKSIREAQDMLMALSKDKTPETAAPDASTFVKSLATAWRTGEVRPTHRQEAKPGKHGRTRPDPFAAVWPVLLGWLEERPDMEAKSMFKRLQASGFGEFPDGQLRTLQRRVRVWRKQIVQQLVYGAELQSTQSSIDDLHLIPTEQNNEDAASRRLAR